MVAKTYQSWKKLSEPFMENKRLYIMVERPKGGEKKVRWYNEAEYARKIKNINFNHRTCIIIFHCIIHLSIN